MQYLILFGFESPALLVVIVAAVLLFGAGKLPQLAKSIGQSRKAFKDGMREAEEEEIAEQQKLSTAPPPQVSQMSDEALMEEMRRRVAEKQV